MESSLREKLRLMIKGDRLARKNHEAREKIEKELKEKAKNEKNKREKRKLNYLIHRIVDQEEKEAESFGAEQILD